jgi:hypothetical protein
MNLKAEHPCSAACPTRMPPKAILFLGVFLGAVCSAEPINFSRQIRPILSENCIACHGPDEKGRKGKLRLDDEQDAKRDRKGDFVILPGKPEQSELIKRIESTDPDDVMPPPKQHKTIAPAQLAPLKEWIKQGAVWGRHWSYEPVVRPSVPKNGEANPVDAFLAERQKQEGLKWSAEAAKQVLIRRVALDVTGLPPTPEEVAQLTKSTHAEIVSYFLAKPAYGEHWARQWLDLARYADSAGYPSDPGRIIWAYRDWVIKALNKNQPFDQFAVEQLAGDLLPNATEDQLIATAFHRNTMTQNEGGTSDEEFRNAAVIDRVNTTYAVFMGTTMACAQCHTHKYDPITITEYFRSYAFLNQSADSDKRDEAPLHSFLTAEQKASRAELTGQIAALESKFAAPIPAWLEGQDKWEASVRLDAGWKAPAPAQATSGQKRKADIAADGTITLEGRTDTDTQTVDLPLDAGQLTALRLETLPAGGNFVVTAVRAQILPPAGHTPLPARYVRVEVPGKKRFLQLAEVEVFSKGANVAKGRPAKLSSQYQTAAAGRAVDGITDGVYAKNSVAHSAEQDSPWWEVELSAETPVEKVTVWNRTDNGGARMNGFVVTLLDAARKVVWSSGPTPAPEKAQNFDINSPTTVTFSAAFADHEQSGFPAASLIKRNEAKEAGWAVAPQADRAHRLTLASSAPLRTPKGGILRVTLVQGSPFKAHVLGKFRLLTSADPAAMNGTELPAAVLAAVALDESSRSATQKRMLSDHYVRHVSKAASTERKQLATTKGMLEALKPVTVPIMQDLPADKRRKTFVQLRGNWQALGDEVGEGVPPSLARWDDAYPKNRLGLARWIVSRDNPLTARVTMNRLWESVFGVGIVRSSEEFGSQGDLPLHPELLDWLAAEFVESGWDTKKMLSLLLNTRAYRQASASVTQLNEKDPDNRFVARGPRFRPSGEMLRDQALAVSGLLSAKMFGPPVRPMRPNLGLSIAFGGSGDWQTSTGEDRHRRSVYTDTRRSTPYPSFATFDAPNRETCVIRRDRSNTPLQAFVTLNDPVFIEASQALARRLMKEAATDEDRLRRAYALCLAREPDATELATLQTLLARSLKEYRADAMLAEQMATQPLGPADKGTDLPALAAWTAVSSVVMNLDEFLMRR